MWRKWDPQAVASELQQAKELGMNTIRSFLFLPDFMPTPDGVDESMLQRLEEFFQLCQEIGIYTLPTFFVGHMSGEDWDVSWREGRDFYTDPWMLRQEILCVRTVVRQCKKYSCIIGWLLSNEIVNYAGEPDANSAWLWVQTLVEAIRQEDSERPISVGDGVWGRELYGREIGFSLADQGRLIDFFGPHVYLYERDAFRHSHIHSFVIRMCQPWGRPVLLEEFGCPTCFVSEEHQADYYRVVFHSTFLAGAVGALGWCFSDFDLPYQRPYSHHAHEMLFGITHSDGSPKAVAQEFRRFRRLLDNLPLETLELETPQAGILVPSYYFTLDYPYVFENKEAVWTTLLQAYSLTKAAHFPVRFVPEPPVPPEVESPSRPQLDPQLKLLLAPSAGKFTAPFWESLYRFVQEGGVFYLSYSHDMWIHNFEALFGVRHGLRYGLADLPGEDSVDFRFQRDFGEIGEGEVLNFPVREKSREAAFCPVEPVEAEVIAVDGEGRPALLQHRLGKGWVVFSTYPLEFYGTMGFDGYLTDSTYRLYRGLRELAGLNPLFDTLHPWVELGSLRFRGESRYLLWLINHHWEPVEGTVQTSLKIQRAMDFESRQELPWKGGLSYQLGTKQVAIWQIEGEG